MLASSISGSVILLTFLVQLGSLFRTPIRALIVVSFIQDNLNLLTLTARWFWVGIWLLAGVQLQSFSVISQAKHANNVAICTWNTAPCHANLTLRWPFLLSFFPLRDPSASARNSLQRETLQTCIPPLIWLTCAFKYFTLNGTNLSRKYYCSLSLVWEVHLGQVTGRRTFHVAYC